MAFYDRDVYLTENFIHRAVHAGCSYGFIYGLKTDTSYECLEIAKCENDYVLHGVKLIGFFTHIANTEEFSDGESDYELLTHHLSTSSCDKNKLENPLLGVIVCPNTFTAKAGIYCPQEEKVYQLKVHVGYDFLSDIFLFRACCNLPLMFERSKSEEKLTETVVDAISKWKSVFHKNIPVFYCKKAKTILQHSSTESELCKDFVKHLHKEDPKESKLKKKVNSIIEKDVETFEVLLQTTGKIAVENTVNHSLVIYRYQREFECINMHLPVDVTCAVKGSEPMSSLYSLFVNAIDSLLDLFSAYLIHYYQDRIFPTLEVYYFYPYRWTLPVKLIYPEEASEEKFSDLQRNAKSIFLEASGRPIFAKINRYFFYNEKEPSPFLISPHLALSPSGVGGGNLATVDGKYIYYHYMQDHTNDDGWGCAYRSFQTIYSFFQFHGYTDKKVPTHKEIQQALVEIGDKEPSFVGSRKWIGSQEVCYCMDYFLKVPCQIKNVSSGDDMSSVVNNLLHHFTHRGSPVMIGGGVLAHTIIGVHSNFKTGETKYLVLDPHYTGAEDLDVVIKKGWCGWKNENFWKKDAFYNLCFPQDISSR